MMMNKTLCVSILGLVSFALSPGAQAQIPSPETNLNAALCYFVNENGPVSLSLGSASGDCFPGTCMITILRDSFKTRYAASGVSVHGSETADAFVFKSEVHTLLIQKENFGSAAELGTKGKYLSKGSLTLNNQTYEMVCRGSLIKAKP